MRRLLFLLLPCLILTNSTLTQACGYAWISDCASQVQLRINGTLDSFDIAACPAGFNFDGIQLGSLQSLSLADAKTITWESCQNNVSAVFLKYRVYEQGGNAGIWQTLSLQQFHQTIDGPYTTRYNSAPGNISLTTGLVVGKTYLLEVYLLAEVDTIGDDFIPETILLKDNFGSNYKMSFIYGGPAASPILLLPHLTMPRCHGGNDGNIYVSTYGNINGLFYNWSNTNLNFFQQFNLVAGNYGITVTNAAGQTASASMQLGQPASLEVQFNNIQPVGCNNSPGLAAASGTGGTGPYQYLWQNGQQNDSVSVTASGSWLVTVTDAHNCSASGSVFIDMESPAQAQVTGTIYPDCNGGLLPGWLFAHTEAISPQYAWVYKGDTLSTSDSCFFQLTEFHGGFPLFPSLSIIDINGCNNWAPPINVNIVQLTPLAQAGIVVEASGLNIADGSIMLNVSGGLSPYSITWDNGADTTAITGLLPGIYCVSITDSRGCTSEACYVVSAAVRTVNPVQSTLQLFPNPAKPGNLVRAELAEGLQGELITLELLDMQGRHVSKEQVVVPPNNQISIKIPDSFPQSGLIIRLVTGNKSQFATLLVQG